MGVKAKAKREALGDKYIGKHGVKLTGKGRQKRNRARKASARKYAAKASL